MAVKPAWLSLMSSPFSVMCCLPSGIASAMPPPGW